MWHLIVVFSLVGQPGAIEVKADETFKTLTECNLVRRYIIHRIRQKYSHYRVVVSSNCYKKGEET